MAEYCHKPINSRSAFAAVANHRCWREAGHPGRCAEYPYLEHLRHAAPKVAEKIKRDATNTTGAAWDSEDAGPNRMLRWAAGLDDQQLLQYGRDFTKLPALIRQKLREKAAPYDDCMEVAQALSHATYCMTNAPDPSPDVRTYLEERFGPIEKGTAKCIICLEPLDFALFAQARRGAAELDTAHKDPRSHTPGNVGFAHHRCNVAQGEMTVDEFHAWIEAILRRRAEDA